MVKRTKDAKKVAIVNLFNDERAKKALEPFINFLNTVNIPYDMIEVNVHDFQDAVVKVANYILSYPGKDFLVNLSGGMRLLMFAVLIAFLLVGIGAEVEGETEDFVTAYSFKIKDISLLSTPLTKDYIEVLKSLEEGFDSTNAMSKRTGIPLTST